MSADVYRVNFETGEVLDIERGTPSLLRRAGKTVINKLSLAERSDEQLYEHYRQEAIRLGLAIEELKVEREVPGNSVTFEEMRSLTVPFNQALAQLGPKDQKAVWDYISPEQEIK